MTVKLDGYDETGRNFIESVPFIGILPREIH